MSSASPQSRSFLVFSSLLTLLQALSGLLWPVWPHWIAVTVMYRKNRETEHATLQIARHYNGARRNAFLRKEKIPSSVFKETEVAQSMFTF